MKKFKFTITGNQYEVEIRKFEDNIATVEVNGTKYKVEVNKEIASYLPEKRVSNYDKKEKFGLDDNFIENVLPVVMRCRHNATEIKRMNPAQIFQPSQHKIQQTADAGDDHAAATIKQHTRINDNDEI